MAEEIKLTKEKKQKLIANVETAIINMLLGTYSNRIADGYYGWHVLTYRGFILQFANLDKLERDFIDEAVESLLKKGFIKVGEGTEYHHVYIELTKQYFISKI